ncbi:tetratricopeptide repeat protein, partial [Nitrospinota bacterium]
GTPKFSRNGSGQFTDRAEDQAGNEWLQEGRWVTGRIGPRDTFSKTNLKTPALRGFCSPSSIRFNCGWLRLLRLVGVRVFPKCFLKGNAAAQFNLGQMYRRGQGVLQDYKEAVKWYRKAAEQGDVKAQNNPGVMYRNGQGVLSAYGRFWALSGPFLKSVLTSENDPRRTSGLVSVSSGCSISVVLVHLQMSEKNA